MKLFIILLTVGATWSAILDVRNEEIFVPGSEELINCINNPASGALWKSGVQREKPLFQAGRNVVNTRLPYVVSAVTVMRDALTGRTSVEQKHVEVGDLPAHFDGRTAWPDCPSLQEIRSDQCGSPAFAVVEVGTDRFCIQSKGQKHAHLSAEDLMSCCPESRCGFPTAAWNYLMKNGLVTGGPNNQGCMPNTGDCMKPCVKKCQPSYNHTYNQDLHYASNTYAVRGVSEIMSEIMQNGPVEAALTVYQDFLAYKTGIYHHVSGPPLGGHAVKILGWGNENSTDYWLAANSWSTKWGDLGFFKMRRGYDECGIESGVITGMMQL